MAGARATIAAAGRTCSSSARTFPICKGRQPVSNVYNARLAQEMICGIYASSLSKRAVSLPLADRTHPLGEPDRP